MPKTDIPECEDVNPEAVDLVEVASQPVPESADLQIQVALERWLDRMQAYVPKARIRAMAIITVDESGNVDFELADPIQAYPHELNSGATMVQHFLTNMLVTQACE